MYDVIKKDNNIVEDVEKIKIENLIYEINGVQVILDSDLAILYEVATKYSWILDSEEF